MEGATEDSTHCYEFGEGEDHEDVGEDGDEETDPGLAGVRTEGEDEESEGGEEEEHGERTDALEMVDLVL